MSNASFLGNIKHVAGPHTEFQSSEVKSSSISAGSVTSTFSEIVNQGYREATLVAFAPNTWPTLAAGGVVNLVDKAGLGAPTSANASVVPAGSVITDVIADDNGVAIAGGTNVHIGHSTFGGTGAANSGVLLDNVAVGNLNSATGGVYRNMVAANGAATGGANINIAATAESVVGSADNFLYAQLKGGPNTAGGLRVTVKYYTLG